MSRKFLGVAAFCTLLLLSNFAIAAAPISESEPNNSGATAQNVNFGFSLPGDPLANGPANLPTVSISGTGDGTFDFYRFYTLGGQTFLDIDFGTGGAGSMDTELFLFDSAGNLLASNDDSAGDPGSASGFFGGTLDSAITTNLAAGTYVVAVGEFNSSGSNGFGVSGNAPDTGDTYTLHIRTNAVLPEPTSIALFVAVLLGGLGFWYWREQRMIPVTGKAK